MKFLKNKRFKRINLNKLFLTALPLTIFKDPEAFEQLHRKA